MNIDSKFGTLTTTVNKSTSTDLNQTLHSVCTAAAQTYADN